MNPTNITNQYDYYSNVFTNVTHDPIYYPTQQTLSYSYSQMETNIMYLMLENKRLYEELMKQKHLNIVQSTNIQKEKIESVKLQNMEEEQESVSSSDQYVAPYKPTQQTQATRKQTAERKKRIRKINGEKNETKNVPKNYGKAIITFIESNKQLIRRIVSKFPSLTFNSFISILKLKKKRINSIADLRAFWLEDEHKDFPKVVRIISNIFLRYHSLQYIFNSRISNFASHIKYRGRLVQALKDPQNFTNIKQY